MRTSALLFIAGLLCGCDGMVEKPVSPPGAAVVDECSEGLWRMQLDDSLALCLCEPMAMGGCFDDGQACHSPQSPATPAGEKARHYVARESALAIDSNRPRFTPIDPSELRFLGKLDDGKPVCPSGVKGRVGHLRRGIRRAPPGLLGASRHMWDEAAYETVAWCGPDLGSEVLR
jgi:hypothetical protein